MKEDGGIWEGGVCWEGRYTFGDTLTSWKTGAQNLLWELHWGGV